MVKGCCICKLKKPGKYGMNKNSKQISLFIKNSLHQSNDEGYSFFVINAYGEIMKCLITPAGIADNNLIVMKNY